MKLRTGLVPAVAVFALSAFILPATPTEVRSQEVAGVESTSPAEARNHDSVGKTSRAAALDKDGLDVENMSSAGRLAHFAATGRLDRALARARARREAALNGRHALSQQLGGNDDDEGGDLDNLAGGQAETTIAVDSTGMHIVVGFNDTRGFSLSPTSVSGFQYSDDGGATFVDGGQLPVNTGTSTIGTAIFPQVFGDPEVKYLGGSNFIYFSIMLKKFSATQAAQTMCFHRSTDYGHTWTGPFEIPSATNPHGLVTGTGAPRDAADKEFADVDPETGRVLLTWTNFTPTTVAPGGVEISSTFSDDILSATPPTWSARAIVAATVSDGQSSIPRFAGNGSSNVYVAWSRSSRTGLANTVGFARSTDNGVTWDPSTDVTGSFFRIDYILGNDRVHMFPGLAVDNSGGSRQGFVYLVYCNNNDLDGADIAFQRSTDGGLTFSSPVLLNSRPGNDRAQWFPWVTVDKDTGRVYVFYYDQGIAANGDLSETTYLFSDDGGATWSKPMPLTDRPFHAGWGNDTGQPNLGDYNQAVAQNGQLFAVWAGTELKGFADQQPLGSFSTPDVFFKRAPAVKTSVDLGAVTFTDGNGNGFIDAGEQVHFKMPLRNYDTNSLHAGSVTGITGTLSTTTAGVTVTTATAAYPNLAPGASAPNATDYVLQLAPSFVPGTHIEMALAVSSSQGTNTLLFTQATGTPGTTVLLSENFDGVAPGSLPAGWTAAHGAGSSTVPWTTNNTFKGTTSNAAFHVNANDGAGSTGNNRWERLISPIFNVPANAEYVTIDMDVAYDTEDDPSFNVLAYDGFFLRITDQTPGRVLISTLAEAFEEELFTGSIQHYPKHLPRNGATGYFPNGDMSVWAGDSQGFQHVHMKFPGAGGLAGATAQLRFEYTQDVIGICADVRPGHQCGVMFDNLLVQSVVSVQADLSVAATAAPGPVVSGSNLTYTINVANAGPNPAASVTLSDAIPAGTTFVSLAKPAGWTCTSPAPGGTGTVTCTKASVASGETGTFTLVVNVACALADGSTISNKPKISSATTPDNDPSNNSPTVTAAVSNPAPVISNASATPSVLWPPNHKLVDVTVNYTVTDQCGPVTTSLAVSSNEPIDGTGDGDTSPDWIITDSHHLKLRAERAGSGTGRVYTITITATDSSGGSSSKTVTVSVPHDQGN